MADAFELTIASHPRWMRLVRQVVQEFAREAGLEDRDAGAVTLAVGEAVGNVIKHAYGGDAERNFSLSGSTNGLTLEVRIRDNGEPFDPRARATPAPEELRVGGRGLFLIREIMDEVDYERDGDANVLCMRKFLNARTRKSS